MPTDDELLAELLGDDTADTPSSTPAPTPTSAQQAPRPPAPQVEPHPTDARPTTQKEMARRMFRRQQEAAAQELSAELANLQFREDQAEVMQQARTFMHSGMFLDLAMRDHARQADWEDETAQIARLAAINGDFKAAIKGQEVLGQAYGKIGSGKAGPAGAQHLHLHGAAQDLREAPVEQLQARQQELARLIAGHDNGKS